MPLFFILHTFPFLNGLVVFKMKPNVDHFIGESTYAQSSGIMVEFKNGLSLPYGSLKSRLERPLDYSTLDKYNCLLGPFIRRKEQRRG